MKYPGLREISKWMAENINLDWLNDEDAEDHIIVKFICENWDLPVEKVLGQLRKDEGKG